LGYLDPFKSFEHNLPIFRQKGSNSSFF